MKSAPCSAPPPPSVPHVTTSPLVLAAEKMRSLAEKKNLPRVSISNTRIICRVCEKQFSQYTCPRCNTRYCSLSCYKSHSVRCTESFMRENVIGELQQLQPEEESKLKMMDILKRLHEEEQTYSSDEEVSELDSYLSEETIQKILSGGQTSLDDLSLEERKHFQRALASGELSKLIQPWDPWWLKPSAKYISLSPDGTKLIQPITKELPQSENDTAKDNQLHKIPMGPTSPLPPITKLTSSPPSPLLSLHLIDIVYSYCFTLRLYNGDWKTDPLESASLLLSISSVLGQSKQPQTVFEVLSHCLEKTCSPEYRDMGGLQLGFRIIDDLIHLLYLGGDALVCLLCDVREMIRSGEKEMRAEKLGKARREESKRKFKFSERKVYFVMCWVHEQDCEVWSSLAGIVEVEKKKAMEIAESKRSSVRVEGEMERIGKPLIKEV